MFLDQIEDPAVSTLVELARKEAFGVTQAVEVVDKEDFRPGAGCAPAYVAQVVVDDPVSQLGVDEDGLKEQFVGDEHAPEEGDELGVVPDVAVDEGDGIPREASVTRSAVRPQARQEAAPGHDTADEREGRAKPSSPVVARHLQSSSPEPEMPAIDTVQAAVG